MRPATILLLIAVPLSAVAQSLLWPTSASRQLSSGFGSDRANRFHMGLDIRTRQQVGHPVFAIADGYIDSVAVSPYGYGKVLYVRHPNGYRSVYAHLDRFAGELDSLVSRLQRERGRYRVALSLPPGRFPVRAGEVIAYSGETGAGPPHLHLEYHAPGDVAVNPFRYGLPAVSDRTAPVFYRLAVVPLSDSSRVEGGIESRVWRLPSHRRARPAPLPPLRVRGAVGLAVEVIDYMDGSGYRLAVPELELWIGGRRLFYRRLDRIPYRYVAAYDLDRDYGLRERTGRAFVRLWRHPANPLPGYETDGSGGILRLAPGRYQFRILARDVFGNRSTLEGILVVDPPLAPRSDPGNGPARPMRPWTGPEPEIEPTDGGLAWVWLPGAYRGLTVVYADSSRRFYETVVQGSSAYALVYWPLRPLPVALEGVGPDGERYRTSVSWVPVPRGRQVSLSCPQGGGWVRFFAHTLFQDAPLLLRSARPGELEVRIPVALVADSFQIALPLPTSKSEVQGWGIYRQTGSGWSFLGARREGEVLVASSSLPGRFRILRDSLAPTVHFLPPNTTPRARRQPQWRTQPLRVRLQDDRSGIDDASIELWINDHRQVPVYDPEAGGLLLPPAARWPRGQNRIRVRLADRAGNYTERTFTLFIP